MIPLPWVRDPEDPARWMLDLPRVDYLLIDYSMRDGMAYNPESASPWQGVRLMHTGCVVGWMGAGHWPGVWEAIQDIDPQMREKLAGLADAVYADAEAAVADCVAIREAIA